MAGNTWSKPSMMRNVMRICDQGFVILRFWNDGVLKNTEAVLESIANTLQSTPYLNPSPQGGRRKTENAKFPTKFGVEQ